MFMKVIPTLQALLCCGCCVEKCDTEGWRNCNCKRQRSKEVEQVYFLQLCLTEYDHHPVCGH